LLDHINQREFGLSDVIKNGWSVFCQQFKTIAILMLIVSLPVSIINYVMPEHILKLNYVEYSITIVELFLSIIGELGIIFLVDNVLKKEPVQMGWGDAINKSLTRFGTCAITSLLAGLIILGFCLLFVIPAIIPIVNYIFIMQVVALRGLRTKNALKYSRSLVKGRWWKIFWINLVLFLMVMVISSLLEYVSIVLPKVFKIAIYAVSNIVEGGFTVATTILFLNLEYMSVKDENEVELLYQGVTRNE
jgi:hypothetical protein